MRFYQNIFILTPLLFTLTACASTTPQKLQAKPKPNPVQPEIIKHPFTSIKDTSFRGKLSYVDGQAIYAPCEGNSTYKLKNNSIVNDVYKQVTGQNNKPVYIEFDGEIIFTKKSNNKTPVVIRVDKVHHMALAKISLQCAKPVDTYNFKAEGNNPYWRINMYDHKLFFATKASNQSYTLKDAKFKTTQSNVLKSENDQGQPLTLRIDPGHCIIGNTKEYWGYTTKAETIHGVFTGCGEPGRLKLESEIEGYYLSYANGKEYNLSLNRDYTVEFKQSDKSGDGIKLGHWKSNTPDQIIVMLTQDGKKSIQEEITFHVDGVTLTAKEINEDHIISAFPTTMTFNKMDKQHTTVDNEIVPIKRQFTSQRISPDNKIDSEVRAAVQNYFKIHRTDPKNTQFSSVRFDLNGDGKDEAIVLLDWCSGKGCEALVFENRKGGLHFSSRISQVEAPLDVSKQQHFLWQSLMVKANNQLLSLDFDGLSYPLTTKGLNNNAEKSDSTGVILFNKGRPTSWFPIK